MGMKNLKEMYHEQEKKIMYRLKSKYSSERIDKLESILRYFCSFLLFVNMCTLMWNINVFANDIEQKVRKEAETLLVVVSEEDSNATEEDVSASNENDVNNEDTVDTEEKTENQVSVKETVKNEQQLNDEETSVNGDAVNDRDTTDDEKNIGDNTSEEDTKKIETHSIDNFSEVLSTVDTDNSLDSHKDNIYATKRLIVLSDKAEFDNCEATSNISYGNVYVLSYDSEEKCKSAYERLKNNKEIVSVEVDAVMETEEESKEDKSEITKTDSELKRFSDSLDVKNDVKVAILDTGIDTSKELFKGRLIDLGINVSSTGEANSIQDDNGHGTEMAEIICENSNSNVKLMPIKVANSSGKATVLNTYIGIQKAIENDAKIINISMNTAVSASSQILTDIINNASDKGVIVVTSAGNNGADVRNYTPSNIEKAIVVSAVEDDNSFAKYSNFGETVDYCAYGKYNDKTGTSYAAANVTGIIADLFSKDKGISDLNIYAIDLGDKGFDNYYGNGLVGFYNIIKYMDENKNDTSDSTSNYFEDKIFNCDWKLLSDEKLNEYIDNADENNLAGFLQNLNKDDLNLIISKNTRLINNCDIYDYFSDEKGEDVEENKIEKINSSLYYEYLLNANVQDMQISAANTRTGHFFIQFDNPDKYKESSSITDDDEDSSRRIRVEITVPEKYFIIENAITKSDVSKVKIISPETEKNWNLQCTKFLMQRGNTTDKTSYGSEVGEDGKRYYATEGFSVVDMAFSYTKPAFTVIDKKGKVRSVTGQSRMNTREYSIANKGNDTLSEESTKYYNTSKTINFNMNISNFNSGIEKYTDGSYHYACFIIQHRYATYKVKYNNTVTDGSVSGSMSDSIHTFNKAQNLTQNGYTRKYNVTFNYNGNGQSNDIKEVFYYLSSWNTQQVDYIPGDTYLDKQEVKDLWKSSGIDGVNCINLYTRWHYRNIILPTPIRTGYTFLGWYDVSGNKIEDGGASYVPASDITLYANWTTNVYTVALNNQGATTAGSTQVYEKYNTGIYKESGCTTQMTTNTNPITKPERQYTLTYNTNGGSVNSLNTTASYTFGGYYTGAGGSGTQLINANGNVTNSFATTTYTDNATIYANWIRNNIALATPTRAGYIFNGWYTELNGGTQITSSSTITSNMIVHAHWTPITYNVVYNANGATEGSTATSGHTYDSARQLTPNGYARKYTVTFNYNGNGQGNTTAVVSATFKGWNNSPSIDSSSYSTGSSTSPITSTGTGMSNNAWVKNLTTTNGATISLYAHWNLGSVTLPTPTRTGYTFLGWYDDSGNRIGNGGENYTPVENKTLYAYWSVNVYTLTINPNGGSIIYSDTNATSSAFNIKFQYGSNRFLGTFNNNISAYNSTVGMPIRTGYIFNGWAVTSGGGTVNYYSTPGTYGYISDDFTKSQCTTTSWAYYLYNGNYAGDATITAQWIPITYSINYNGNGATEGSTATSGHTYDSARQLTPNGYARKYTVIYNYNGNGQGNDSANAIATFKGWNNSPSTDSSSYGTGSSTSPITDINDGMANSAWVKNLTATNGDTLNLYAHWTLGTVKLPAPSRIGYTFAGWYDSANGGNKIADAGMKYTPEKNITLYAHWTPNVYKVELNNQNATTAGSTEVYEKYNTGIYKESGCTIQMTANSNPIEKPEKQYTLTYNANGGSVASQTAIAGYTFGGYYTSTGGIGTQLINSNGYVTSNLVTTKYIANTTIYAKWTRNNITLITPSRTGYIFNGWYTEVNGGTQITSGSTITSNMTIYAHWTPIKYNISYNSNVSDGSISGNTVTSAHTYDEAKQLTTNGFTRKYTVTYNYNGNGQGNTTAVANATFNGWNNSKSENSASYDVASSESPIMNINSGMANIAWVKNLTATDGTTLNLYAHWTLGNVTLPTPTRTGYLFDGWYDASKGGNKIGNAGESYIPEKNITIYAHWTPITYNINYNTNVNDGSVSGNTATSIHTYDETKQLTTNGYTRKYTVTYNYNGNGKENTTAIANATFNGWNNSPATNSSSYNAGSNTSPIMNINSGMADNAWVRNLTTTNKDTLNLYAHWTLGSVTLPTPTRVGHNFLGWYLAEGESNRIGSGNDSYTPTENITLYAHWEAWTLKTNINLIDAETKNTIKENATFKVYEYNISTGKYDKFITNLYQKNDKTYETVNYLTYSDTNLGKFRIIEETAPYGYYGEWTDNTETTKVFHDINIEEIIRTKKYEGQTVNDKGTIALTIGNTRVKGEISANIIDMETKAQAQTDATLEGAIYGIYARENIVHADGTTGVLYAAGSIVQRATIENGKLLYTDLEQGRYYIKQITPPKGYSKKDTEYNVNLLYEGEKVELIEKSVTLEEKVNKQAFQVLKIGNTGSSDEFVALEGVGFKIHLISELSKVKNGEIKSDEEGNYKLEDFEGYDFTNEPTVMDYTNSTNGQMLGELFTDEDGVLVTPEIPYGKYIVEESTVPEDRFDLEPFFVTVNEDNRVPKKIRIFYNEKFVSKIQVIKKDRTTGKTVLKANSKYRILNKDTNKYVEQWITYPVKTLLGTEANPYTTDETGTVTTALNLDIGNYELQEIGAPEGYVLQGYEGKSEQGQYTSEPQDKISFSIYKTMATEYDEDTGDAILKVEQYNEQQLGSLNINVTGQYLSSYSKDENANYRFNYEERPIQGIEFTLYAKYNVNSQDNQNDIVYYKDEAVASVLSDGQGNCIIDNLPIGIYYLKQTKAIDGFAINNEEKEIEITYEGQEKAVVYRNSSYVNNRQKVEINLVSKDAETNNVLTDAKFGLYAKERINYIDATGNTMTIQPNELIYAIDTDKNGKVKWSYKTNVDLPLGMYYIKQIETPYGYVSNNATIDVNAKYRGENKDIIELNLEFTNQKSKVNIVKQDVETKNGLAGTEMKLLNTNREELYSYNNYNQGKHIYYKK